MDLMSMLKGALSGGGGEAGAMPIMPKPKPNPMRENSGGLMDRIGKMLDGDKAEGGEGGFNLNNFLRDTAAGLATGTDYRSKPLESFGRGYSGAAQSQDAREAEERRRTLQDEDRDIAADDRAFNRKMALNRDARAEKTAGRAGQNDDINRILAVTRLMNAMGGGENTQATRQDILGAEGLVNKFASGLDPNQYAGKEIEDRVNQYRQQVYQQLNIPLPGGAPQAVVDPGTQDQAAQPTAPTAGSSVKTGDGSSKSSPVAAPTPEQFEALPVGTWFINPSTGKPLRKTN